MPTFHLLFFSSKFLIGSLSFHGIFVFIIVLFGYIKYINSIKTIFDYVIVILNININMSVNDFHSNSIRHV